MVEPPAARNQLEAMGPLKKIFFNLKPKILNFGVGFLKNVTILCRRVIDNMLLCVYKWSIVREHSHLRYTIVLTRANILLSIKHALPQLH